MTRHEIAPGAPVLVSACLLGVYCRYDGQRIEHKAVMRLAGHFRLIPVCPEQLGGLPTPRDSVELLQGRALTRAGLDVTAAFACGAAEACRIGRLLGACAAILQPRSPSCGAEHIYDGSFSGRLIPGQGLFARALLRDGLAVYSADNLSFLRP